MIERQLKVAVLGAAGTIAPAIVHDLGVSEEVERMVLFDLDGDGARAVAQAHGGGKTSAQAIDARADGDLAAALRGADLLVNTASYRINLDAMGACLDAGCHYMDLGGLYWIARRQLELGPDFERAGLLALLGIGSSPGKTNLMALRAVRELGAVSGAVERIDVAAAGRDPAAVADGRVHAPYALQTLLDELTMAPVVIREGKAVEIEPLSDGGALDFGEPVGRVQTIFTLHSELATFVESFGCAGASFRLSLAAPLLERLKQLVGASSEELAVAAREVVPPSGQTVSVHLVTARLADGSGVTVRALTRPHFGLGGSIVSTAAPAAASVRLLARGSLQATGAHPPERCLEPDELFAELQTRGCSFSVTRS